VLRRLRVLDILAFVVCVASVAGLSVRAYGQNRGQATSIRVDAPTGSWVYPLDQDRRFEVLGPIGRNVIEIHAGSARVVEADCRDKICISMGAISKPGSWIACLPNQVFVRVLGTDADTDALAY
jgi:hypothetical protein